MKKIEILLLASIILGALFLRLYRFDSPIADWHAWRQADTSSVSRYYSENGIDLLMPKYHDLSNVPSGMENPMGYRFVEFPIYNAAQASLSNASNVLTLEQWGRVVTIVSSLLSIIFIFLLVSRYASSSAGLFAAFFFAFIPYSIYYGRTILPDPTMVMFTLGGIYFFDKWMEYLPPAMTKNTPKAIFYAAVSILFIAIALLLKPFAIFFLLPLLYIAISKYKMGIFKKWYLWIFVILSILPLVAWRMWISQFPEGIPASSWLFNEGNIRFKGAFFYWIFADRIGRLILGYWGIGLFLIGILAATSKTVSNLNQRYKYTGLFFISFLASSLIYVIVVARGNVQHDYYQLPILPTLSIFLGLGAAFLIKNAIFSKIASWSVLIVSVIFMVFFGWYFVRDYFNINNSAIIQAGNAVQRLTPKNAKIIAPYNGDTSFLYQTARSGWASFQADIDEMRDKLGAEYVIFVNPIENDKKIGEMYTIVEETPQYILIKLSKPQ